MQQQKSVWIAGGSGLIGQKLVELLLKHNYKAIIITRTINTQLPYTQVTWQELSMLETPYALVNLCGESINARTSRGFYRRMLRSRIEPIEVLSDIFTARQQSPAVWVQASSLSIYGNHLEQHFNEDSKLATTPLAQVYREWEQCFYAGLNEATQGVLLRIPYVLSRRGGYLPATEDVLKKGIGILGCGRQAVSWVHEVDMVRIILHAIENSGMRGAYNCNVATSLNQREIFRAISQKLKLEPIPSMRIPARIFAVLAWLSGKNANTLLQGRRASNTRLLQQGFEFSYNDINSTLDALYG